MVPRKKTGLIWFQFKLQFCWDATIGGEFFPLKKTDCNGTVSPGGSGYVEYYQSSLKHTFPFWELLSISTDMVLWFRSLNQMTRPSAAWGRTVVVQTGTQPPAAVPLPLLNPITSSLGATRMQCQASEEYEINQVLPGNLIKKSKALRKKNTFHTIFQHNPRCHTPVKSTPEVEVIKRYTNDWNAHVPWALFGYNLFDSRAIHGWFLHICRTSWGTEAEDLKGWRSLA